jgi:microcystin-dependent protein
MAARLPIVGADDDAWGAILNQWLLVAHEPDGTAKAIPGAGGSIQPGMIVDFAGGAALPAGYLDCDGASYLRTTYPALFAAIGVTWGAADGTHFNVPDLRGRVTVAKGTAAAVLTVGLTDGVAAVGNRRPHHRHTVVDPTHNHAHTDPGHTHPLDGNQGGADNVRRSINETGRQNVQDNALANMIRAAVTGIVNVAAATGITVGAAADSLDAPAFAVVRKIIAV